MVEPLSRHFIRKLLLVTGAVGGMAAWLGPMAFSHLGNVGGTLVLVGLGLASGAWLRGEFYRTLALICLRAEELRSLEASQAAGQVALGLAHELRNPLAAVRGFLQLMARRLPAHREAERYLAPVLAEIDRATAILEDFLRLARRSETRRVPSDLGRIVEGVVTLLEGEAFRRGVRIYHCYREGLAPVPADPEQLKQVFLNLLLNALAAVSAGGRVWIGYELAEGRLSVIIRDDGCGMDEKTLSRLGEPFFTTKPDGTGLGVALSLQIIRAHGGKVEVASRPGEGTVFRLSLPADSDREKAGRPVLLRRGFRPSVSAVLPGKVAVSRAEIRTTPGGVGLAGRHHGPHYLAHAAAPLRTLGAGGGHPGRGAGEEGDRGHGIRHRGFPTRRRGALDMSPPSG
ncbi:MAG: ATP-binding protein [Clostridia bacterium]|jgi:signal transduction histidine kinase|nr:ATP-binding protein [Clostridia bacterium]MDH7572077.1 ATP-binding protein [Clostridia bacterium]